VTNFAYYGRDRENKPVNGILEAASASNVADWLLNSGVTPVVIKPAQAAPAEASDVLGRLFGRDSIKLMDLMMFSRQMYTLARSGIPILRALQALESSSQRSAMKQLLYELRQSLDSGLELSQAMQRRGDVFDPFYVAMVRVGETTGRLEEIFLSLFKHLEFQKYMREQVKSATRYPSFVILAMVGAITVINLVVIPAFAKVFENMQMELPLMTRILLGTSKFMLTWWPALLVGLAGLVLAWRSFVGSTAGRLWWDRNKLKLPVAGTLLRKAVLSQATRSLALVFRSGVPIVQGLSLAAEVVENAYVSAALTSMRSWVERGESLLASGTRTGIFTPVVLQMIMIGEESGTLGEMLDEIGQMYQAEVEYELKTLSQNIEPILIVMLGGMVLVLALGVFMPMWDMGSGMRK
jgi:MSHA biogenesis protein MshG